MSFTVLTVLVASHCSHQHLALVVSENAPNGRHLQISVDVLRNPMVAEITEKRVVCVYNVIANITTRMSCLLLASDLNAFAG